MGFEVFKRSSRATTKDPMMSIGKRGILSLNGAAFALLTGDSDATEAWVELLYDPEIKLVGARITDPKGVNAYKIRKANKSRTYMVSASAFTRFYGIPIGDKSTRYRAHDFGDGVVGFSLDEDREE